MNTKLLLILGSAALVAAAGAGVYLSKSQSQQPTGTREEVRQIESQSESDDVNSIEADLKNTDTDNVDQETVQIQSELNSSQ